MTIPQVPGKWFFFLAFLASFTASIFLVARMPVFSHIDELAHFDYVLKVQRHRPLVSGQEVEPDLAKLWTQTCPVMNRRYMTPATPLDCIAVPKSHELMQPSGFYRLSALLLTVATPLQLTLGQQVLFLRLLCAMLLLGAHVLTFYGIYRLNKIAGLLSLAYLIPFIPVDLLRFSNDSAATFTGAAVFFCLVRMIQTGKIRFAVGVAFFFLLATLSKLTALAFLSVAIITTFAVFTGRHNLRRHLQFLLLIAAPTTVATGVIAWLNYKYAGSFSGSNLQTSEFLPQGVALLRRILSAAVWQWWHESWLTMETLVKGKRGIDLYPVPWMVTWMIAGQVLALGYFLFGKSDASDFDTPPQTRRWIAASLLSTSGFQVTILLIMAFVGQIWLGSRMLIPIEAWPLTAACLGYTVLARNFRSRPGRSLALVIPACIFVIFALMALRSYLRMRAY